MLNRKNNSLLNSRRNKVAVLAGLLLFVLVTGCAQQSTSRDKELIVIATETVTPQDQMDPSTQQSGVIVVSGFFSTTFGDPLPGKNGRARIRYTLTTSAGKVWILVFDKDWHWPANGIQRFHLKQVVVKGLPIPDGRLLVESLELP